MMPRWRASISHDATGKFSSRCPLPERNSPAVVMSLRLYAPFPGSASSGEILVRGIQGIEHEEEGDSGQRHAPQGREPVETQDRLKRDRHQRPGGDSEDLRPTGRE